MRAIARAVAGTIDALTPFYRAERCLSRYRRSRSAGIEGRRVRRASRGSFQVICDAANCCVTYKQFLRGPLFSLPAAFFPLVGDNKRDGPSRPPPTQLDGFRRERHTQRGGDDERPGKSPPTLFRPELEALEKCCSRAFRCRSASVGPFAIDSST